MAAQLIDGGCVVSCGGSRRRLQLMLPSKILGRLLGLVGFIRLQFEVCLHMIGWIEERS
jgi:hypothetical protein